MKTDLPISILIIDYPTEYNLIMPVCTVKFPVQLVAIIVNLLIL